MMSKQLLAIGIALVAVLVIVPSQLSIAQSSAQPANKMAVAGSALSYSGPGTAVTLLTGSMKTSNTEDAVVTVSAECDILTQVETTGNDDSRAFGQIEIWVEIDGTPIPVASDDTGADAGHVVFCNRAHEQTTSGFTFDSNATIKTFQDTRTANSFQWITLNLAAGTHVFDVKATLTTTATNNAVAQAVVGKRTLTVDPTQLAVNAAI